MGLEQLLLLVVYLVDAVDGLPVDLQQSQNLVAPIFLEVVPDQLEVLLQELALVLLLFLLVQQVLQGAMDEVAGELVRILGGLLADELGKELLALGGALLLLGVFEGEEERGLESI